MAPHDLQLQLLVPRSLSLRDGEELLRLVERLLPAAMPGRCGRHEPLRATFAWPQLPRLWSGDGFLWRSERRGAAQGHVIGPSRAEDRHTIVQVRGDLRKLGAEGGAAAELLRELAGTFGADHGALRVEESPPELIVPGELEERLPGPFWANVLGPPYVALLGRDVVGSAPAHVVAEVAPDVFYLQLSERPTDIHDDAPRVRRRAAAVAEHLGRDAFTGAVAPRLTAPPADPGPESVADVLDLLTRHAVAAIEEEGWVAPVGMAVVHGRTPEIIGAASDDPGLARADVEGALRTLAARAPVAIAALLTAQDDVLGIDVEVAGEAPFAVVRSLTRDGGGIRLGDPEAEPRALRGWTSAHDS